MTEEKQTLVVAGSGIAGLSAAVYRGNKASASGLDPEGEADT